MKRTGAWMLRRLPSLYASRDATVSGAPLERLLGVLGAALDAVEADVTALGDDAFVERAGVEALPLLAERLGVRLSRKDPAVIRGMLARAVRWRRARGAPSTIEDVISVTTGWSAEVEEGFRSVLGVQDIHHPLVWRAQSPVIRSPVLLSDPLSRRAQLPTDTLDPALAASATWSALPGEPLDAALRRLGGADAGRQALLPRTVDLRGPARPDAVLIRTTRMSQIEREDVRVGPIRRQGLIGGDQGVVFALDPDERKAPLAWRPPADREAVPSGLGPRHEAQVEPVETARRSSLLTPTALAEDSAEVEAQGALAIRLDGVALIGPALPPPLPGPARLAPLPARPLLRLADPSRLAVGDTWIVHLIGATGSEAEVMRLDASGAHLLSPPPDGSTVRLRFTRGPSTGHVRAADGTWSSLEVGVEPGVPRSCAVAVGGRILRLVSVAGGLVLRSLDVAGWVDEAVAGTLPDDATGIGLTTDGARLFVVAPAGPQLAAWRLDPGAGWTVTRCDAGAGRAPVAADAPAVAVVDGRLFVHGGRVGESVGADTWSVPVEGGSWRRERWRARPNRAGGTLRFEGGRLWLGGGWSMEDFLDPRVYSVDPAQPRGAWEPAPALPIESRRPGVLALGAGPSILMWADRLRPTHATLGPRGWVLTEEEGPPPPADGELVVDGDRFLVVGPCPIRQPTLAVGAAGRGLLAFLPDIDLRPGETTAFDVTSDGGSTLAAGEPSPQPRPGGRSQPMAVASAPAPRHGVVGRWSWHPYVLRHRSLSAWDRPLAPGPEGVVGVDPFLGRVLLPAAPDFDEVRASSRIGRPGAVGAGAGQADRMPPAAWVGPDGAPLPFDREWSLPVEAWVSPDEAPFGVLAGVPAFATVEEALATTTSVHPILAVRASPTLGATRLGARIERGFTLRAADPRACPRFDADIDGVSLGLHPARGGDAGTDIWLAGLWLAGTLEIAATAGVVDVRWCTLGLPAARRGLRALGSGHLVRTSRGGPAVPTSLEIRVYGCLIGSVELPPWVRLVAAGCTFDGGGAEAILAPGADVRLRHCTVRGAVEVGELRASSCIFAGPIHADRTDAGWVRHSLAPAPVQAPPLYRCTSVPPNFLSCSPEDPHYLRLADDPRLLRVGDEGRTPGAWHDQAERLDELSLRTDESLPMGMVALHDDRCLTERARALRRTP